MRKRPTEPRRRLCHDCMPGAGHDAGSRKAKGHFWWCIIFGSSLVSFTCPIFARFGIGQGR